MLTYILNSDSNVPIYEQLYNFIKNDIINGKISANEKLPSKRKLADHLKISIITVENAYEQLVAEGYLYSKPRKGYFAANISADYVNIQTKEPVITEKHSPKKFKYEFHTNSVDTEYFPFSTWAKLLREVLSDKNKSLLNKSDPKGIYDLRYEISVFLNEFRNIKASPEQIIVGAGSEYLINIIIQLLGNDKVYGVENPGYQKIPQILLANHIIPHYIKLDDNGVKIEELDNINVLHLTPSHQFPLGIVTPVKRRYELLKWVAENESYIIEDDYDSEFRYGGKPIPALQSLDKSDRVIYLNTFTKNLAPSLRISYMVLPKKLLKEFENKFLFYSNTVSCFEQHTLAKFMKNRHFERYINKMRLIYKERVDFIINFVAKSKLKDYVAIKGDRVGLHIIFELKQHSENEFIEIANKSNVSIFPISNYYKKNNYGKQAVIIGYSGISKKDIERGLMALEQNL